VLKLTRIENPHLSIGIPVFNEIRHIHRTLESIKAEALKSEHFIEVLVSDNGSTDGTTELLDSLQEEMSGIENLSFKLIMQGINKGFNFNCDTIIRESRGDYLWVLGAQETLLPRSLSEIFATIAKEPRQIVLNAEVWDEATNTLANPLIYGKRPDTFYSEVTEFYSDLGGPCRSLSLNIVRADLMKDSLKFEIKSHYWGMFERHAFASVIEGNGKGFYFISFPVVRILIEESGWQLSGNDDFGTETVKKAFPGFHADIEMAEIGLSMLKFGNEIGYSIGVWRDKFGLVRTFATAKSYGLKVSPSILIKCIRVYRKSYWFWFLGLPILLFPSIVLSPTALESARTFTHVIRRVFNKPAK
jgi:glycosyltransferase involved in cell wall biosynthesis